MSLDVYLTEKRTVNFELFSSNVTHNLTSMAEAANLYKYLWRPEELGISRAGALIAPLRRGLKKLKSDPDQFRKLNPENGWGDYEGLVRFVERYLAACLQNPDAKVEVSR